MIEGVKEFLKICWGLDEYKVCYKNGSWCVFEVVVMNLFDDELV